jgi:hypothetical protein
VSAQFEVASVQLWPSESETGYPYSGLTTTSGALNAMKAYWDAKKQNVERTVVHMLSGRALGGGVAYLSTLCRWHRYPSDDYGYGMSAVPSTYGPDFSWDGSGNPAAVVWDIVVVSLAAAVVERMYILLNIVTSQSIFI